jgi:hypothetical protein
VQKAGISDPAAHNQNQDGEPERAEAKSCFINSHMSTELGRIDLMQGHIRILPEPSHGDQKEDLISELKMNRHRNRATL